MLINAKNLLGLPVETEGKTKLGKISDFDIDIESHIIKSYFVESGFLTSRKLIISRNQVVSINKEKMVVKDNVVKEEIKKEKGVVIKQSLSSQRRGTEPALSARMSQK